MKTEKQLFLSSLIFTLLLVAWPVVMGISQPLGELVEDKFQWILQNQFVFKINFFLAFLISPSLIFMMISQLRHTKATTGRAEAVGIMFLGVYAVLCSMSYGAQFVLVPKLIEQNLNSLALVTYFDSGISVSYFVNQMGYLFWAIGAIILFYRFLFQKGPIKSISVIYLVSAALSVVAFSGLVLENKLLNSMTFVSGLLLLPAGITSMVWSFKNPGTMNKPTNRMDHELPWVVSQLGWRFHHIGIPTKEIKSGEKYLPHLKFYTSGFEQSPFGIEWMRFDPDCALDELVKTVPHIAFEVDDLDKALKQNNFKVLTTPNSPGGGVRVAMIEHDGAPIELIEFVK